MPIDDLGPEAREEERTALMKNLESSTPYESIPALAANEDYINKMARLRELYALKLELFNDDEKKGPLGEYEALKHECAAMQLVNGQRSVTYIDMRLASVAGGVTKGKITGAAILDELGGSPSLEQLRAIIASARDCDAQTLLLGGVSADAIEAARTPDKPRAGSIRVELVGGPKRGATRGRTQ